MISNSIHKDGDKFVLMSKDGKRKLGTHDTREGAVKQEAAIKASEKRRAKGGSTHHNAEKMMKGEEGKGTGASVRAAIRAAQARGLTLEEIGAGSNRSAGTIGAILSGEIKNPPSGLAGTISKIPGKK